MRSSDHLPVLELVPTGQVRFHEHPERKRTLRLVERLRQERVLRNPPIVAHVRTGEYVLLDGANRVSAFQELDYSHVPVQVIDYGDADVLLKGWHHLLVEGRGLDLKTQYEAIAGVEVREVRHEDVGTLLELRQVFAALVDHTARCWGLFPGAEMQLPLWMGVLDQVIAGYEGKTKLERIKLAEYDNLPSVFGTVEHELVLYPVLSKVELLQLVAEGIMIPTGITRHLIPGRALGLNLDLAFLTELEGEAAKIAHFREFVDRIEVEGRIRFYEEPLFIMNE